MMDSRYLPVGDIISSYRFYGFDMIHARPFVLSDLLALANASGLESVSYLAKAIDNCIDVSVYDLLDVDFMYLLAWERMYSFPESPDTTIWTCNAPVIKSAKGFVQGKEVLTVKEGMTAGPCGYKNVSQAHGSHYTPKMMRSSLYELPKYLAWPTVRTLVDVEELPVSEQAVARYARYIPEGDTLSDKIQIAKTYDREHPDWFQEAMNAENQEFGLHQVLPVRCTMCGASRTIERRPKFLEICGNNTEERIFDMQYTMMLRFNMPPNNDMPSKQLIYLYSRYLKEKAEAMAAGAKK